MKKYVVFAFICSILAGSKAIADPSPLVQLRDRTDIFGLEGVGRLEMGNAATCTGALIEPDLVLTAAHCIFDKNHKAFDPTEIVFRAGLMNGSETAERRAIQVITHASYDKNAGSSTASIPYDLALLRLQSPIPVSQANPFDLGKGYPTGTQVSVLSYGRGRNEALSWQKSCSFVHENQGVMVFDCDATFGSSGAPVFVREKNRYRIISVVSSIGDLNGVQMSFGMDLENKVAQMRSDMMSAPNATAGIAVVRKIQVGGTTRLGSVSKLNSGSTPSGAKFVKSKN